MNQHVTVILLNYRRADDTIACVRSLQSCGYTNLDILVIDNGSGDGSEKRLRSEIPEVEIIQTGVNLGFAAGNNVGILHVLSRESPYILLLNNDTIVENGFLHPMILEMESDKNIGAAGGLICYHPDKSRVWYAGGEYSPLRATSVAWHLGESVHSLPRVPQDITFITGCLMLVRREVFESVGMFDERFFMYFEDAELSLRILSHGFRLRYVPEARIYHKIQDRPHSPFLLYYFHRNRLLFAKIVMSRWKRIFPMGYVFLVTFLKCSRWIFTRPEFVKGTVWGITDYFAQRYFQGRGLDFLNVQRDVTKRAVDL